MCNTALALKSTPVDGEVWSGGNRTTAHTSGQTKLGGRVASKCSDATNEEPDAASAMPHERPGAIQAHRCIAPARICSSQTTSCLPITNSHVAYCVDHTTPIPDTTPVRNGCGIPLLLLLYARVERRVSRHPLPKGDTVWNDSVS